MYCAPFSNERWKPIEQELDVTEYPTSHCLKRSIFADNDPWRLLHCFQDVFVPILALLTDMQCLCGSNNKPEQRAPSGRFLVSFDVTDVTHVHRQIAILVWRSPLACLPYVWQGWGELRSVFIFCFLNDGLKWVSRWKIMLCIHILPNAFTNGEKRQQKKDLDAYRSRL